jgi:tetratricopeptide (TPR) repeat protein
MLEYRMRQIFLVLAFCLLFVACQKTPPLLQPSSAAVQDAGRAITQKNWSELITQTAREDDPLLQLAHVYALFQSNKFQEVLDFKQTPSALDSYFRYLSLLSAYQVKNFDYLRTQEIPHDLPKKLKNNITIAIADSFLDENKLQEARQAYLAYFNSKDPHRRAQVLLKLAGVEWELGMKEEALQHYQNLYENFPLDDGEDLALLRLVSGNKFQEIETSKHLQRVQQLRRSAQFERAGNLLETLNKALDAKDRAKLEFAEAQLQFAQKQYTRVENRAKEAIKRTREHSLKSMWSELMGWAQLRLGRYEDAKKTYQDLLNTKIPSSMREAVLFRLGVAAVDFEDYKAAVPVFEELLKNHSRGRFVESSHWFGAWSLYQRSLSENPPSAEALEKAIRYLEKLPNLSNGTHFIPQSLYWRYRIYEALGQKTQEEEIVQELQTKWRLSFYSSLIQPKSFNAVTKRDVEINNEIPQYAPDSFASYQETPTWQRLESFRALHLMEWARFELELFLNQNRSLSREDKIVVAQRLRDIGDWPDLIRWTERHIIPSLEKADEDQVALKLLYPLAHEKFVLRSAEEARISPFIVWGVMREESRFEVEVRSGAGAEGLMQLMPSLGKRLAQALGEKSHRGFLLDARRNIRLGTYHLRELLDEVRELPVSPELRIILAVAAYNAGIDPVRRWVQEQDTSRVDVFIESIPYTETRQYVKRVLQTAMIYSKLYELPQKTVARTLNRGDL